MVWILLPFKNKRFVDFSCLFISSQNDLICIYWEQMIYLLNEWKITVAKFNVLDRNDQRVVLSILLIRIELNRMLGKFANLTKDSGISMRIA